MPATKKAAKAATAARPARPARPAGPATPAKAASTAKTTSQATSARAATARRRGPAVGGRKRAAVLPGLTPAAIVQAALALVADEGVAGLSTRKLGERLHCEAMSIYHHFASKGHLLDALVDHALASYEWPPDDLPPLERLRRTMHAFRALAHRFPAFFPYLALHRLNTATGVRFIERVLAQVHAVVHDDEKAARHFRAIGYFLVGAGLDETAGYAKGPSAMEPVDDAFIQRECPHLAAAARWFQRPQWDVTFALGAEALLAALQRDSVGVARAGRVAGAVE